MRNRHFEETLLADAAASIRDALPRSWQVDVKTAAASVDAVASIVAPDGVGSDVAIAIKQWTTAPRASVLGVLGQLRATTAMPVLLVTDHTNRPLREACEALDLNYVDQEGWMLLKLDAPAVLVRTFGSEDRPAPRVTNEVIKLTGVAVSRTIRTLLEIEPPIGVRELASVAGVRSPGSVSKLLPSLVAAHAIERDESGRIVEIKRRALVERWVQDYSYLRGNGVTQDFLAPRGVDGIVDQLRNVPSLCVTGGFAAKDYLPPGRTPVVPTTRLALYSNAGDDLARRLGMMRVDRAASNVVVTAPRDPTILDRPLYRRSGLPLAPLGLVIADLMTLPGRETALADQLMDQLETFDPLWATT